MTDSIDTLVTDANASVTTNDITIDANVIVSNSNVTTSGVVLATIPASMINGILASMDSNIVAAKATLDADILAAQIKAKSAVLVFVTTAKAALSDIESWVDATPGKIQVAESTVSKVLQDIKAFDDKVITVGKEIITDAENILAVPGNILNDIKSGSKTVVTDVEKSVGFFSGIAKWWKSL